MRKLILALFAYLALASLALADFTGKDASLATITFKNATGACTAVVCVPQAAITDSTGATFVAVVTVGADAQSNTANGLLTYTRNLVFNGTTWDRWQGAVTNAGTFAVQLTGATNNINNIAGTVSLPTGAATAANQATEIGSLATIATNTGAPIPSGTNLIGKVGIDQTTPGTTNAVSVQYGSLAAVSDPCQTAAKVYTPINVATATNTIIVGVAAKKKYVCGIFLYPAGADNIAIFQATTGTACATALVGVIGGTTVATGIIATAQAGFVLGNGASAVAATTVNQTDLCIVTSAAVQLSGVVVTVDQ